MPAPQTEVLITVDGVEKERHVLVPGDYLIGRNADCAIRVDADLVSRQHAMLVIHYDQALIEDLGSANGTSINGQPVTARTRLWPNQKIQIGTATIELRRLQGESPTDMSLAPAQQAIRRMLPAEMLREKKYDIGAVVARGGMGAILDAREAAIERKVAMKVMLATNDAADIARFIAEAKVTGQLEHPNIVPIHEFGVDENGQPFYTMKMVKGITLKKVLDLMAAGTAATIGMYPLAALLTIFQKVCDAIAFAHSREVIHRDLKPENIMLGDFGEVLVMDWGLAKVLRNAGNPAREPTPGEPSLRGQDCPRYTASGLDATLAGSIMGTPQFMAPEQARGEIERLDARSDIYSLGAILYQILALRVSVTGTDAMEVVGKVGRGEIEPLDSPPRRQDAKEIKNAASLASSRHGGHLPGGRIPDSLAAVVRKAMSLGRTGRYQSVAELQRDIEAYQGGFATSAENAGAWKQFTLLVKRHKAASIGIAAVLLVGSVLGTKAVVEGRRATQAIGELKKSAPALLQLAESEAGFQRFDSALGKLDAALALDPGLTAGYWRRAWLLLAQEKFAESAQAVRTAQTRDPANAARLGAILPLLGDIQSAPPAERWNPTRSSAVLAHLNAAGASGEAVALSKRFQISAADKLKLVNARLKEWFGGSTQVSSDGGINVVPPKTIDTLEPLRGLPITNLGLNDTRVKDLDPLRGMPLRSLSLISCNAVSDISPLRGMPLKDLNLTFTSVSDLAPLEGMPLRALNAAGTKVSDLAPLRGMPLKKLSAQSNDFSPLAGMKLSSLNISGADTVDISTLRNLTIENVALTFSNVRDLKPLIGLRVKVLDISGSRSLSDLSPLLECTELEELRAMECPAPIEPLRAHKTLKVITYSTPGTPGFTGKPVEQFWKEYDAQQAAGKK